MKLVVFRPEQARAALAELPGWVLSDDAKALTKRWVFPDFAQAFLWVGRIAELAEGAGHHPDIRFGWGYVDVLLTTHDAGGITARDISLARKIG